MSSAQITAAPSEIAMIVNQHDETRRRVCPSETLKAMFLSPRKAVGHRDRGVQTIPFGQE